MFFPHTTCRACGHKELTPVLDLGIQPLANSFTTLGGERDGYAPLRVLFCRRCTLAQLSVVVRPDILYRNYAYVTSKSEAMDAHFTKLLVDTLAEYPEAVEMLEVGSNNGAFLSRASKSGLAVMGLEPASNLVAIANARGVKTINRFFDTSNAVALGEMPYLADLIVARHVFAHIHDWQEFIHALQFVSHDETLVVIEVPYVEDMFAMSSWDQCYHEHYSYVSIRAIVTLLEKTPWQIQKVVRYPIHGGCVAIMLRTKIHPKNDADQKAIEIMVIGEECLESQWHGLQSAAQLMKMNLLNEIRRPLRQKQVVCGFGASAKATVWLNYCGLTEKEIAFICDSTEQKQGKVVAGTQIPVVDESELMKADYAVCFSWNYFPEIREKFKAFSEKGGKWIVPCPKVRVV